MSTPSLKIKDHTTGKKKTVRFKSGNPQSAGTGKTKKKVKFKAGADLANRL